jgi:predicted dehydrogenase
VDYTRHPRLFQVRKAARYLRLYGPARTLAKVQGQYHSARRYNPLPAQTVPPPSGKRVGLIGAGNFAFSTVAYYLRQNYGATLRAVMDVDPHRAASLREAYEADYYTTDAARVLDDPEVALVYVVSNHASHAEYAIEALRRGKHVHIEKPHVVNADQLERLVAAMETSAGKVTLGFNRPESPLGRRLAGILGKEPGPGMYSWFVAGHAIEPGHWYFDEKEGGRVLGNLCHWTDFTLRLVPPEARYPVTIRPTRWDKSDCDIAVTYTFGDGTIAAITFSAKGHSFEGVRERFSAHKGDVVAYLDDFYELSVDRSWNGSRFRGRYRDHGHEGAVQRAYGLLGGAEGVSAQYVWETGELFLKTKEALDRNAPVVVTYRSRPSLPRR